MFPKNSLAEIRLVDPNMIADSVHETVEDCMVLANPIVANARCEPLYKGRGRAAVWKRATHHDCVRQ